MVHKALPDLPPAKPPISLYVSFSFISLLSDLQEMQLSQDWVLCWLLPLPGSELFSVLIFQVQLKPCPFTETFPDTWNKSDALMNILVASVLVLLSFDFNCVNYLYDELMYVCLSFLLEFKFLEERDCR